MNEKWLTRQVDVLGSSFASALRGWNGIAASPAATRPEATLALYDIEGSPYCRLVREALTELDLDVMIYPCPRHGSRFRPLAVETGGRARFPLLHDTNTDTVMYESLDIVAYLYETYGGQPLPLKWQAGTLQVLSSVGSTIARLGSGIVARPSRAPDEPLELYSFEGSPFARPVRERLCELELPYLLRSAGRTRLADWVPPPVRAALRLVPDPDLPNRKALLARAGAISIPYLIDPNTGAEMADSGDILDYLESTYALEPEAPGDKSPG